MEAILWPDEAPSGQDGCLGGTGPVSQKAHLSGMDAEVAARWIFESHSRKKCKQYTALRMQHFLACGSRHEDKANKVSLNRIVCDL